MGEVGVRYWGQLKVFSVVEVLNHSQSAREKNRLLADKHTLWRVKISRVNKYDHALQLWPL